MSSAPPLPRPPRRLRPEHLRLLLQIGLPVLVLAATLGVVDAMLAGIEMPAKTAPATVIPTVRTIVAEPTSLRLDVHSQGTVQPRTQVALAPQVSGRVTWRSPALRPGGFFAADEVLLELDDQEYRLAVVQQKAAVARAELKLAQEKAEADVALRAWRELEGEREPDALVTRELHVKSAQAELDAMRAALQRAELDLDRTKVRLPFAGRVRAADVDIGQQVAAGAVVAQVYGTAFAEVRLPIPDSEVAFLDLPTTPGHPADTPANGGPSGHDDAAQDRPTVVLTADFAGTNHQWHGVIERTEGEIDRRTRQLTLVARVADPYGANDSGGRPPLTPGMYVEATVAGRTFDDVIALPRAALRLDGTVLVLDPERRLRRREVAVLRLERQDVLVRGGLTAGEEVCTSPIETFVEGMPVRRAGDPDPQAAPDDGGDGGLPAPTNGGR